ncbi:hypothetical protein [Thauera phenylacetica]|jgi:hypothetical protein
MQTSPRSYHAVCIALKAASAQTQADTRPAGDGHGNGERMAARAPCAKPGFAAARRLR